MDQTNPVPSMQHIFVSYSRADREMVDVIVARLKNDGFNVWIDREEIQVGTQWGAEIVAAVGKAYAFLLMLSPSAVDSRYVHDEVYLAYKGRGPKELIYVPVVLSPVQIEDDLSLPLARVQYIEYYRDPEAKYAQIVKALQSRTPKPNSPILAMGLALLGLKPSNFDGRKQKHLLDSIANFTGTPRAAVEIAKPIDKNGYIVVKMPADGAYQLKTAALNRDARLINYGIKALRLTGDRSFVWVKSGRFGPFRPPKAGRGCWVIGSSALLIALLLALFIVIAGLPLVGKYLPIIFPPPTLTATNTDIPTPSLIPSSTSTATETITLTASLTVTTTDTVTSSPTSTFTPTDTPSITPTWTFTPTPTHTRTPTNTPNPPPAFELLGVGPNTFYCPSMSDQKTVVIFANIQDPSGVASVDVNYWLERKDNGKRPAQADDEHEPMHYSDQYDDWGVAISIQLGEFDASEGYWFQFRFKATDKVGVTMSSPEYLNRVTYSCYIG